ncbi:MAG: hypothetical protein EBV06_11275 [Planctomycetia bacterium]|nr:hypothetical protein [Planctomycetia bacterium]
MSDSLDDFEDDADYEIPEGTEFFADIPPELGVHPLLLGVLNALVFFAASTEDSVNPSAADAMIQRIVDQLLRLKGADLRRVKEDMDCLLRLAKDEKWEKAHILFLKTFLKDIGIEAAKEGDE